MKAIAGNTVCPCGGGCFCAGDKVEQLGVEIGFVFPNRGIRPFGRAAHWEFTLKGQGPGIGHTQGELGDLGVKILLLFQHRLILLERCLITTLLHQYLQSGMQYQNP